MFGNPETTPGGLALKFYSSIRIDIRKIQTIKEGEAVIGSRHRVKIVKNKVAPPFRLWELDILESGISKEGEIIDLGLRDGIIGKSGAFFKYQDKMLGQGREAVKKFLLENPQIAQKILKDVWGKKEEKEN